MFIYPMDKRERAVTVLTTYAHCFNGREWVDRIDCPFSFLVMFRIRSLY